MAETQKASIEDIRALMRGKRVRDDKEVAKASVDADGNVTVYESTIEKLGEKLVEHAKDELKPAIIETIAKSTADEVEELGNKLDAKYQATHDDLVKLAQTARPIEIKVGKKTKPIEGVVHAKFPLLLQSVNARLAVLMVGPAGTGKTHSAAAVADALDTAFYSISVGSQTSKSDLLGYMNATGIYVPTAFRRAYEEGGVFLLDEADAGNSNVLILLNAALSNGYMAFPDKMVKAHEDFRMIASANTYGTGASRQYVGRNQLDAATLDRFTTLEWPIDALVEESMAGTTKDGRKWLGVVRAVRKRVQELDLRVVISPRAVQRGVALLGAGVGFQDVLDMALVGNIPGSDQATLRNLAETVWNR